LRVRVQAPHVEQRSCAASSEPSMEEEWERFAHPCMPLSVAVFREDMT